MSDRWHTGGSYEAFMGRWSRLLAREFLEWLRPPRDARWLETGCGTGALTAAIVSFCQPRSVLAIDPSEAFVEHARARVGHPRVTFQQVSVDGLSDTEGGFDVAVSALVLNFVEALDVVNAQRRLLRPGGVVAACVWDYAGKMEFLRAFWDEALAIDNRAAELDEGRRFPLCSPPALGQLFDRAGLTKVETGAIEVETAFTGFDDYWEPFLGGTGPAPAFVAMLDDTARDQLRERLRRRLQPASDGRTRLRARAWCVRGVAA